MKSYLNKGWGGGVILTLTKTVLGRILTITKAVGRILTLTKAVWGRILTFNKGCVVAYTDLNKAVVGVY